MLLVIDNFDSFTYNLVQYLGELGAEVAVYRNDELTVEQVEALTRELAYFVECIAKDETPFNDGAAGLRVVKMLEAANTSISKRGELVYL